MQRWGCLIGLLLLVSVLTARAEPLAVRFAYQEGDFALVRNQAAADLLIDSGDAKVVSIAANDLAADIERVTGRKPTVRTSASGLHGEVVLIGTLGHAPLIDALAAAGKLDTKGVAGQWESYVMATVADPMPGVARGLVIAGSDRRGTAFGVYELSSRIGVSPWHYWADVPTPHHDELLIAPGNLRQGPPSVKYRGIFLNDEDWGLQPWAAKTVEPETGDIGPKTYARIFELMLRLKANFVWPAMHDCTKAFNLYPQNKVVADDYAIVMGSSHCEPMLRNNVTEWGHAREAQYNYVTNRQGVLDYWKQRLVENGKYENVYTLGMRGIHDSDMAGGGTQAERVQRLNRIMADQRQMLSELVAKDRASIPQIFCPYKEVLTLYQAGAVPPDDVTLVWADDNHGYIRQLSTPREQQRSGGAGVYYHISYWGRPHDYLWLCTTPPALVWEELSKAYDQGARRLWVINVGDLKPAEIDMTLAMEMAYDINRYRRENIGQFTADFAARVFGPTQAAEIASILDTYYHLNYQRKPEHMGFNTSQNPSGPIQQTDFSTMEIQERLGRFAELAKKTDALYAALPAAQRDAFYELVAYPVRGSNLMNQKLLYWDLNARASEYGLGRLAARYAELSRNAYESIQQETAYYNDSLAGGKWKHIMSASPHPTANVFKLPSFKTPGVNAPAALVVIAEGSDKAAAAGGTAPTLPLFNRLTRRKHFVALFNPASAPMAWSAKASKPWVRLSESSGSLEGYVQVWVDIDYAQAPAGEAGTARITFTAGGMSWDVDVKVVGPEKALPMDFKGFVEDAGYLSLAAEHFTGQRAGADGAAWQVIPGLGRLGDSMAVFPTTTASNGDAATLAASAPALTYEFYNMTAAEKAAITVQAIPTHRLNPERGLRYAVAVDDEAPQVVDLESPENSQIWSTNVLRGAAYGVTTHRLAAGRHTLRIYMVDPGVVLDHLLIDLGGLPAGYLPPAETRME